MKRLIAACGLLAALMICLSTVSLAQAKGANFAGTWTLDKSKSGELPRGLANADSVTWTITQDSTQVTREQKLEGGQAPGGGGGGGGRGMGMNQPLAVKLDGSETVRDLTGPISGKATVKSKWLNDGKTFEVTNVVKGSRDGQDFTFTTTEHWELADDGKTLKVHQKRDTPQGPMESKLVFTKK